jgi:hypothetical protein
MNDKTHPVGATSNRTYRTGLEALEILEELELKYDLFKYKIDGYSAWRLLRFKAATEIQNLPLKTKPDYVTWDWLKERLVLFIPELIKFIFPHHAKFVFKTFSSALRERKNNRYKDIYFDDLIDELGDYYKIETINSSIYWKRRMLAINPISITTAVIDLISGFLAYLGIPTQYGAIAREISCKINTESSLRFLTQRRLGHTLRRFFFTKRLYAYLFRRIKPSFVLTANQDEYAIWAAAKELGIITLEFQHGLFPRYDPDALPFLAADYRESLIVPDKILLYGEYWLNELKKNQTYINELVVVGSPLIDQYRKMIDLYLQQKSHDSPCVILLTTQGIDREHLIQFIAHFLRLAQGKLEYELDIKLHPGFEADKRPYELALGLFPSVHIILGAEEPSTFELQLRADFHISISSASHYDALGLGVPTIVLPLATYEDVQHLVEDGHAKLARDPESLLNIFLSNQGLGVPKDISSYYYATDALNNIKRVIEAC